MHPFTSGTVRNLVVGSTCRLRRSPRSSTRRSRVPVPADDGPLGLRLVGRRGGARRVDRLIGGAVRLVALVESAVELALGLADRTGELRQLCGAEDGDGHQ